MRLRQLECFVRVCELGSLTRAAEQLNIAQPALGLQIRALEDEFGVQLLIRHSRGIQATDAGTLLLEQARTFLRGMRELRAKLKSTAGFEDFTLGLSPNMAALIASSLLEAVGSELPKLRLGLVEGLSNLLVDWVKADEIDLALAYNATENHGIDRTPILREGLAFIERRSTADQGSITFADALRHTLVMPGVRDSVRDTVEQEARRRDLTVVVRYEIQSMTVIKDLVRSGMAHAILPLGTVYREVEAGELAARRIVDPQLSRVLYLVRSASHSSSVVERSLLDLIRRTLDRTVSEKGHYGAYVTSMEQT